MVSADGVIHSMDGFESWRSSKGGDGGGFGGGEGRLPP